jgi:hypothetical protein
VSPLDSQIPIPNSTNIPTAYFPPLLLPAISSPVVSTSKNTVKVGHNSKGKQTAHRNHQPWEAALFIFNERGHTVSVFVIFPHVLLLKSFQAARNEHIPYLSAQEVQERSWYYNGPNTFGDLFTKDFIMVTRRVAHCQLHLLELRSPSTNYTCLYTMESYYRSQ